MRCLSTMAVKLLCIGMVVIVLFWALGLAPLTDLDEGAFSEASREMMVRGDWISPWLLDFPRFDKPVLFHWLQIASFHALGLNSWGARLPSAIAGLAWVAGIAYWVHLLQRSKHGKENVSGQPQRSTPIAIAIAIGCLPIPAMSRVATADALLNASLLWCLIYVWRAAFDASNPGQAKRFGRTAAALAGIGLLTKGPIAVLVPAGGLLMFWAFRFIAAAPTASAQGLHRVLIDPWAWLILLAIPAPWYTLQFLAQGMPFIEGFLGLHNVGRFTSAMHGFSAGPLYHPAWTAIALFPFLPLMVATIAAEFRPRRLGSQESGFLWSVWIFVMIFFTLSATKLPHYTFYGLSALMVLLAVHLTNLSLDRRLWLAQHIWLAGCIGLLISSGHLLEANLDQVRQPYFAAVLSDAVASLKSPSWWVWTMAFCGLVALVVGAMIRRDQRQLTLLIASFSFSAILFGHHVPSVMTSLRGPIPEMVAMANSVNAPLVSWQTSSPSISFWANRVVADRPPEGGEWVLMQSHQVEMLARSRPQRDYEVVIQKQGLSLLRPRQG